MDDVTRRGALAGALAMTAASAFAYAQAPFQHRTVVRLAEQVSRRAYVAPEPLSPALAALDYDAYGKIGFRRERMLWAGEGRVFTADLRPRGYLFPQRLAVNVVADGRSTPLAVDAGLWRAEPVVAAVLDGASGLRLQSPINRPDAYDEIAVFQGGSYFRSLAAGQGYGLSARGLAIGAGDMGEEHPAFTAFWLETPPPGQVFLVLHALLDSPSVTGAYRFVVRPGATSVFEVEATLFPRVDLDRLGVAPQTSMFLFGAGDRNGVDDFRSAAHDSDGLAVLTAAGDRLWRPLANPPSRTRITTIAGPVRGFGLQQRARALADFDDLEARYDRRPSLWVEPVGDWGEGAVHLVELPARHEGEDNIAAFWRPAELWRRGERRTLRYRLHWGAGDPAPRPALTVAATRVGADGEPGVRRIVVDWAGPASAMMDLQAVATADAGTILDASNAPHPEANTLRTTLCFRHPSGGEADLNLHLARGGASLSETWAYRWTA